DRTIFEELRQGRRRRHLRRGLSHADHAASRPQQLAAQGKTDMNQNPPQREAPAPAPSASTPGDARKLAESMMDVMSALLGVIERETEPGGAGNLRGGM